MTETLTVSLGDRSYPIIIEEGLLARAGTILRERLSCPRVLVVTDENVNRLWGDTLRNSLTQAGITADIFTLPAGEATKSFAQLESLLSHLLEKRPDRRVPLIAFGGGVIGDITGFAASIILRGIPFVQIPTTLLAMVDSSVGGKTGINTAQGKNLVGSFYQPEMVLMDTQTLHTLPPRELTAGYAEVIKYGCIMDAEFFAWLEQHGQDILRLQPDALVHILRTSCHAKATIVAEDERETGRRALLNFGHSFGHALEAECGYDGTLLHGEAVAIGMNMAAMLSASLGLLPTQAVARLTTLLQQAKLPISPQEIRKDWDITALLARMQQDKKVKDGTLQLILLHQIGAAGVSSQTTEHALRDLWNRVLHEPPPNKLPQ
jgi:3-dehydroquinate synthase